jgi:glyoxylase I family protein
MEVVRMPTFEAVAHLSLTVTDPDRSAEFYHRVLGTETVMSTVDDVGPVTLVASPSLMIGLRRHTGTAQKDTFDPTRIGLDHVAFQVASRDELEAWRENLVTQGVTVSEIVESPFGLHLNLKDPDNIALELFVPSQA